MPNASPANESPRRSALTAAIRVEVLHSRGQSPGDEAEENLRLAIEATGVEVEITYTEVLSQEDATSKKFLGTPSIRVEGIDVEYGNRPPEEVQTGTRYYNTPDGWKPFPHARLIANAILEAHTSREGG